MSTSDPMHERDILRKVQSISRLSIDHASTQNALRDVRSYLVESQSASHRRFSLTMRGVTIAAAVMLILVGIWWAFAILSPSTTVAQQLQRTAEKTQEYKGWVHITTTYPPPTTLPSSSPASRTGERDAVGSESRAPIRQRAKHVNRTDGSSVQELDLQNDQRIVHMRIPSQKLWYIYDSRDKQLRISEVSGAVAYGWSDNVNELPLTPEKLLQLSKAKGTVVTKSNDGELTRFDIANSDDASIHTTVWSDPQTNHIRKVNATRKGDASTAEYTYGAPRIRDIYDVGVPRDAEIVDGRPAPDAARVVTRLSDRIAKGFGNGVAVLTESRGMVGRDGVERFDLGELTLYARHGDRNISMRYTVTDSQAARNGAHWLRPIPNGWPWPKLEQILAVLGPNNYPLGGHITIGDRTWDVDPSRVQEMAPGVASQSYYLYSIGSLIWPNRELLGLNIPGTQVTLVTEPARPSMIALARGAQREIDPRLPTSDDRRTYWMDPEHDDMPVETIDTIHVPSSRAGEKKQRERITRYLEYAQLPNGQWYPTRWEVESSSLNLPPLTMCLQIFPGATLDEAWFTNPNERFKPSSPR